ncbi:hypothetical protein [Rahnella sp. PCH160]|uniref:hypothetical protein n=1 Tax=Rahnella sp. PCH160 TaxID=3447928 RepID=UPI0039FD541D
MCDTLPAPLNSGKQIAQKEWRKPALSRIFCGLSAGRKNVQYTVLKSRKYFAGGGVARLLLSRLKMRPEEAVDGLSY